MIEALKRDAAELSDQLIAWRRDFHRYPELAYQEERTSSIIHKFLEDMGIPVQKLAGTGLLGRLEGNPAGKTIALRADMDALPLQEEGDKEYASMNPGVCHACGHDGHMAILMGAARLLLQRREHLRGNVVFLFQPAEEKLPGGARKMIEEGALNGVDAVFGLHLWQSLPTGFVGCVQGTMMAAPDEFSVTVIGEGGHGSMPQTAVDPILAASHLVTSLQSIISRNIDPLRSAVISLGTIHGGTICNIIPSEVRITGTVRTFDSEVRDLIERRLKELARKTCDTFEARCEVEYVRGYPPLVNDEYMTDLVRRVARTVLGEDNIMNVAPVMGGEDFAYYLQQVPGAFFLFGSGDGKPHPHHHPCFDIDERALPQGALLLSSVALEFLQRGG